MLQSLSDFISKVTRGEKIRIDGAEAQWKKVSELTPGTKIAVPKDETMDKWLNGYMAKKEAVKTPRGWQADPELAEGEAMTPPTVEESGNGYGDILWDEIVSIKRLSPERVYDIEVEGTHNFVAGRLVDTPLPDHNHVLTDEPLRGPPAAITPGRWQAEERSSDSFQVKEPENDNIATKSWFGGFFAHNTYISGNVGIGTTIPAAKLHILQTAAADAFRVDDVAADTTYFVVDQGGNVGIGTTIPGYKLDVSGGDIRIDAAKSLYGFTPGGSASSSFITPYDGNGDMTLQTSYSAGDIFFKTAGANTRMIIDSTGNVGIGTTIPAAKLHILQTAAADAFRVDDVAADTTYFVIDQGGNVGIGTTGPGAKLAINAATTAAATMTLTVNGSSKAILGTDSMGGGNLDLYGDDFMDVSSRISADDNSFFNIYSGNVGIGITIPSAKLHILQPAAGDAFRVDDVAADTTYFVVDQGGNVGIGTTVPAAKLSFPAATAAAGGIDFGGDIGLYRLAADVLYTTDQLVVGTTLRATTAVSDYGGNLNLTTLAAGRNINFAPYSGQNSYFSSGNVGIGTTIPAAKLHILQTAAADAFRVDDVAADTTYFVIDQGGNVGIGTTGPTQVLDVVGRIRMGTWTADGDAAAYQDAATNSIALITSDRRLKKNIVPLTGALDIVSQLNTYKYNDLDDPDGSKQRIGLMAQDVLPVIPELTYSFKKEGSDETYYSVHYDKLAALAVGAIREQQLQIENISGLGTGHGIAIRGNVGIGTTGPVEKLDVSGRIHLASMGAETCDASSQGTVMYGDASTGSKRYLWICRQTGVATFAWKKIVDLAGTPADFAEYFGTKDRNVQAGDIVSIDRINQASETNNNSEQSSKAWVVKTDREYQSDVIGIVSTNPAMTLGEDNFDQNDNPAPIALSGRIPVKVSTINGQIKTGDPIASSQIAGVGMKATHAGVIIGKALQDYDNPDPNAIGNIVVFVNLSWYDPDVYLTDTGQLHISSAVSPSGNYTVTMGENQVSRIGAFAQIIAGSFKAGFTQTKDLLVENSARFLGNLSTLGNLSVGGKLISPVIETEKIITKDLVATGSAQITSLQTGLISPLADNQDIVIQLGSAKASQGNTSEVTHPPAGEAGRGSSEGEGIGEQSFGRLLVRNSAGETVTSIDSAGNIDTAGQISASGLNVAGTATVSGQLWADDAQFDNLTIKQFSNEGDATVSGTLYADNIQSEQLTNMNKSFGDLLQKVSDLEANSRSRIVTNNTTASDPGSLTTLTPTSTITPTPEASVSGQLQPDQQFSNLTIQQSSTDSAITSASESADLLAQLPDQLDSAASLNEKIEAFIASSSAVIAVDQPSATTVISSLRKNIVIPSRTDITGLRQSSNTQLSSADTLTLTSLTVVGSASLPVTTVSGSLLVDGSLILENNKLASLGDKLYLSSLNLIDFMGGRLTIDAKGNLTVEGILYAKGGIVTDRITSSGGNLTIDSDLSAKSASFSGQLLANDAQFNNLTIKQFSNEGDATVSGTLTTGKLSLSGEQSTASSSGIITSLDELAVYGLTSPAVKTTGTAGSSLLPAGAKEIIILNNNITGKSLIYLTPASSANGKSLYVSRQESCPETFTDYTRVIDYTRTCLPHFTVAIDDTLSSDVKFNWWIIN